MNITPHNRNSQPHGYWEVYFISTKELMFTGHYFNGVKTGITYNYNIFGDLIRKSYYV